MKHRGKTNDLGQTKRERWQRIAIQRYADHSKMGEVVYFRTENKDKRIRDNEKRWYKHIICDDNETINVQFLFVFFYARLRRVVFVNLSLLVMIQGCATMPLAFQYATATVDSCSR